jgi:hypothetical protein
MSPKLQLSYPANIAKVSVQRRRFNIYGFGLYHLPFLALYIVAFKSCYETAGTPHRVALAHHTSKGYDPDVLLGIKTGAWGVAAAKKPKIVDEWGGKGGGGGGGGDDPWGNLEAEEEEEEEPDVAVTEEAAAAGTVGANADAVVAVDADGDGVNGTNATAALEARGLTLLPIPVAAFRFQQHFCRHSRASQLPAVVPGSVPATTQIIAS